MNCYMNKGILQNNKYEGPEAASGGVKSLSGIHILAPFTAF